MELTPDLLLEAKFSAARRGYDMAEVDDFLERCAEGLDVLLTRLRSEFERAERCEAEVAELRAGTAAMPVPEASAATSVSPPAVDEPDDDEGIDPAPEPPRAVAEQSTTDAAGSADESMRILVLAERTAEAAIADAKAEAARIRAEAEQVSGSQRAEAETLLERARTEAEAEARRAGNEIRRSIQGEVVTLRRDRDSLNDDIRMLRRWLDDQRGRLRTTARDLQRLAEDPAALRDIPPPEISEVELREPLPADDVDDGHQSTDDGGPMVFDDEQATDGEPTQAVQAFGFPSGASDGDRGDSPTADPDS